ncbi:hypothetical protein [Absidia glauca]|uniref:Uncharacterized protein n=1 Tax=Absidia glauca TaxID=4829 RepID=A0A163MFM7_ABSGL|nr:hypothetical protein [Absidia glauca]
MGPRKPEIEYVNLELVGECNATTIPGADPVLTEALTNAKKLADGAASDLYCAMDTPSSTETKWRRYVISVP